MNNFDVTRCRRSFFIDHVLSCEIAAWNAASFLPDGTSQIVRCSQGMVNFAILKSVLYDGVCGHNLQDIWSLCSYHVLNSLYRLHSVFVESCINACGK